MFAIPLTMGFADKDRRLTHYGDHGADFGTITVHEYERLADNFLGKPKPATARDCIRRDGDMVRYDRATNELGILSSAKVIRTYFRPTFCWAATPAQRARGKCHKQGSHDAYARKLC